MVVVLATMGFLADHGTEKRFRGRFPTRTVNTFRAAGCSSAVWAPGSDRSERTARANDIRLPAPRIEHQLAIWESDLFAASI